MKLTKKLVRRFLSENRLLTVATHGSHPWIACVYYGFDDDLTIYFISDPTTMHGKHIGKNEKVAIAIADSNQKPESKKKGVQLYGLAELIKTETETRKAIKLWRENMNMTTEQPNYESVKGRMYKITPKKVKYFNQALFEVEDGKEPILEL